METNITNELSIIEKKQKSWGLMGINIHNAEITFQARAQESLSKIAVLPSIIEDVKQAETTLKEVKADQKKLMDDRKAITSKFDPVFERLMAPEKSFTEPLKTFEAAIIRIKQADELKRKQEALKASEIASIKQSVLNSLNNYKSKCDSLINNKVNQVFTKALNDGMQPDQIEDLLIYVTDQVTPDLFACSLPNPYRQYVSEEDVIGIINQLFIFDPEEYVKKFAVELERKFADYDVAFLNKQAALQQAALEMKLKEQEIEQQKVNQNIAAEMDSLSFEPVIETDVKDLKKGYVVDMPETVESVRIIMSAFFSNIKLCLPKLKVNKWFAFTPNSAAIALAKVKNEDPSFQPTGLIFKEVDRL